MTQGSADCSAALARLRENLQHVIRGKTDSIDVLITALLAGGSVLMEDVPGVGKTTLAKALARSLNAEFSRIQFTPDLLPADILGASVYNQREGSFTFRKGPIFCHVLLADEINRASPRTQSALLEAMNERQATIEGQRHALPEPFLVLATQNPIEHHGTYPLPEAQLDRFLVQLDLGYPAGDVEADILQTHGHNHPLEDIEPVLSADEVATMQGRVRSIRVEPVVSQYVVALSAETRSDPQLRLGVSRAGVVDAPAGGAGVGVPRRAGLRPAGRRAGPRALRAAAPSDPDEQVALRRAEQDGDRSRGAEAREGARVDGFCCCLLKHAAPLGWENALGRRESCPLQRTAWMLTVVNRRYPNPLRFVVEAFRFSLTDPGKVLVVGFLLSVLTGTLTLTIPIYHLFTAMGVGGIVIMVAAALSRPRLLREGAASPARRCRTALLRGLPLDEPRPPLRVRRLGGFLWPPAHDPPDRAGRDDSST